MQVAVKKPEKLRISDQEIRNSLEGAQLKIQRERGIDPETGRYYYYDDTRQYIESAPGLPDTDKQMIFSGNVGKVYPRAARLLRRPGP